MIFAAFVVMVASSVVLTCCIILVFHAEYEDGLVGRIGLVCLGMGAFARTTSVLQAVGEHLPYVSSVALLIWIGLACFFARHTRRFLNRARKRDHTWHTILPNGSGKQRTERSPYSLRPPSP